MLWRPSFIIILVPWNSPYAAIFRQELLDMRLKGIGIEFKSPCSCGWLIGTICRKFIVSFFSVSQMNSSTSFQSCPPFTIDMNTLNVIFFKNITCMTWIMDLFKIDVFIAYLTISRRLRSSHFNIKSIQALLG